MLKPASPSSHTDERLIGGFVRHGDQEAFRILIGRHRITMRRALFAVLNGDLEEMREVEQEVLIALCSTLHNFKFRSSFSTWFYRFCRNKAIDYLRRKTSRIRRELRVEQHLKLEVSRQDQYDPEQRLLNAELQERVRCVLGKLNGRDREILIMKDIEDMGIDEISSVLGIPAGTVKSRLHRVRRKAARLMGEAV